MEEKKRKEGLEKARLREHERNIFVPSAQSAPLRGSAVSLSRASAERTEPDPSTITAVSSRYRRELVFEPVMANQPRYMETRTPVYTYGAYARRVCTFSGAKR